MSHLPPQLVPFLPGNDRTLRSRFECKYLIDERQVPALRRAIGPFMRPDEHASLYPDHRYEISSLYFDSSDLMLYRQSATGEKNRFKLRVRTYADDVDAPVFFEIKRRMSGVISKNRIRVSRPHAHEVLRDLVCRPGGPDLSQHDELKNFLWLSKLSRAGPVMRVRYMREAYESLSEDPVRITFDTELCHVVTMRDDILHTGPGWRRTPIRGVILEIKFTQVFPAWMNNIVSTFQLDRRSVSKYGHAIDDGRATHHIPDHIPRLRAL